jgi:hypothetical protein
MCLIIEKLALYKAVFFYYSRVFQIPSAFQAPVSLKYREMASLTICQIATVWLISNCDATAKQKFLATTTTDYFKTVPVIVVSGVVCF